MRGGPTESERERESGERELIEGERSRDTERGGETEVEGERKRVDREI
jgi:hypothetical protein